MRFPSPFRLLLAAAVLACGSRVPALAAPSTVALTPSSATVGGAPVPLAERSIVRAAALAITTAPQLAAGTVGSPYSATLAATGGTTPYTWAVNGTLPGGLSLNSTTGVLSGTPLAAGAFTFTIQVSDGALNRASQDFSLTIAVPALVIATEAPLFNGTVGSFYSQSFLATGGTTPYQWAISGQIPPGLTFNASLPALTGTPTTAGTYALTVKVTDSANRSVSKNYSVTVELPRLVISAASPLPTATVGQSYRQSFTASGGTAPYVWSLTAGYVPGLSLDSVSGIFSGTPETAGTYEFVIQARDAAGSTGTRTLTLTVAPQALTIVTAAQLPDGILAVPYAQTISAAGGTPPYTWSANGLPQGLQLDASSGAIAGTPAAAGQLLFTVRVTDSARATTTTLFRLNINAPALPAVHITGLPATSAPGDQYSVAVALDAAYPVDITGKLTLTFASDVGAGDSTIQFSTGGKTVPITIPAGSTAGVFSTSNLAIQTGTAAGTITLAAELQAGGADLTPFPSVTTRIERAAPVVRSAELVRSGTALNVRVVGFSTAREVTQAVFRFRASGGNTLQQAEIAVAVDSLFATWYQNPTSSRYGSQFVLTQPFTVQGDASAVSLESVTLSNRLGQGSAAGH